jgi:hypothetical protein
MRACNTSAKAQNSSIITTSTRLFKSRRTLQYMRHYDTIQLYMREIACIYVKIVKV